MPFCQIELKAPRPPSPSYPKEINTLGDHIRKRRLDLHLSQKQLAKVLGVTSSTLVNWEGQRNTPALFCMPKIIEFLGYNPLPETQTIAAKLRRWRLSQGITQRALAHRLGIDPCTLARWERGDRTPMGLYRRMVERTLDEDTSGEHME